MIHLLPGGPIASSIEDIALSMPIGAYGFQSILALFVVRHLPDELCLGDLGAGRVHASLSPTFRRRVRIYAWSGVLLLPTWLLLVSVLPLLRIFGVLP